MVLFASACGYQSFCDRHHHGAFVLGRVLAGRFAIAIIMVFFFWVIGLLSAFFETVLGQVCSQMVPFLLRLV